MHVSLKNIGFEKMWQFPNFHGFGEMNYAARAVLRGGGATAPHRGPKAGKTQDKALAFE